MSENEPIGGCNIHGPDCTDKHTSDSSPEETTEDSQEQLENERIRQKILEVKEIVEKEETTPNVREILQDVNTMAVITDLKSFSRFSAATEERVDVLDPVKDKKHIDSIKKNSFILSVEDLEQLKQVLSDLGVSMKMNETEKITARERRSKIIDPFQGFCFYKKENMEKVMRENKKHFPLEIRLMARIDIDQFLDETTERGILEGIPVCDVEKHARFIEIDVQYKTNVFSKYFQELVRKARKDKNDPATIELENYKIAHKINDEDWAFILEQDYSGIHIEGPAKKDGESRYGSFSWGTFDPESQEAQARKKQLKNMIALQEEMFGYED